MACYICGEKDCYQSIFGLSFGLGFVSVCCPCDKRICDVEGRTQTSVAQKRKGNGYHYITHQKTIDKIKQELQQSDMMGFPAVQNVLAGERPCKQCGKLNDVGVHKCWWCESPPS